MKFPKLVFGVIVLKFVSIVVGIDVANFDFNYDIIGEELPGRARVKDGSVQDVDGTEESRERTDGATDKTGPQKRPWAEQEQVSPEEIFIMFTKAPMYARRNFLQSSEVSKNRLPGKDQGKKSYVEKRPREEINKMFHKGVSNTSEGLREKGGFVELSRHKNGEPIVVSPDETENAKASSKEAISKEYIPFVDASSKETGGSSLIEDSGEIEAAMQGAPLAYIRVVRQAKTVEKIVCNGGDFSGDIIIGVDFIINKKLSNNEYTEGVLENQQLKMDIDHALKTVMEPFINKDFTGVNFTLDVNVTSIRADGHVLVDIAVADNLTGNCMSGKVDTEVRKSLANALIDMDRYQRLKIGAEVYDISDPLMEPNKPPLNQLIPAVCVTCDSHHNCTKRPSNEWYCRFIEQEFFNFGEFQSDERMSRDEEFVSKKITIESLFPYGSQLSDTIFISVNGLLSVGRENSSFTPTRMPVGNQSLLAVYWADLDLLTGDETAEIFYQLYKKENATSDKSKEIFRAANAEVVKHSNDKKTYDALSVLVVTWVEVPADSSSDERVSFQCVVITDGETTYAMYIYSNGKMNFDPRTARSVEVGWGSINLDPKRSSYYTFDQILGNTGATGRWFFKIGERENFKVKCLNWYRTNQNDLQELSKRNAAIPPCPCNEFAAFASGLWLRSLERERCYDVIPIYGDYGRVPRQLNARQVNLRQLNLRQPNP